MNGANQDRLESGRLFKAMAFFLVACSMLIQIMAVSLAAGYWNSPHGLVDSSGNKFGFNETLTIQQIRTLISGVSVAEFVKQLNVFSAGCLMAHMVGIALLLNDKRRWVAPWFFLIQPIIFFYGSIGLVIWPMSVGRRWTGESIVEGPLSDLFSSATWVLVSLVIGIWFAIANHRALGSGNLGKAISC